MLSGESREKGELLRNGDFNRGLDSWTVLTKGQAGIVPGTFKTIKGVSDNRVAEFTIKGPGMARICQEAGGIIPGRCYELTFFIRNATKNLAGPGIFGAEVLFTGEKGELLDNQSYGISNPSQLLVWTYHHLVTNEAPPETKKIKVELYGKVKDPGNVLYLMVDDIGLRMI
jgi:hypothetical protein